MRLLKFILSLSITLAMLYAFNNRLVVSNIPVPPLGLFLNPFEGFYQNAETTALPYVENISLKGLKAPVKVQYDSTFIPHIFAENTTDLFRAQGYIIAQHRLWQMDFQSYAAAGRISELIGPAAITYDRLQRRKGMVYGAEKSLESMKKNKELWSYIESYTEGVNAYIEGLAYKDYPLEYKLLGYEPERWTPLKSALLLQYMIENLTGWDQDIENTNAYTLFGKDLFNLLYPNYPESTDQVAPSPSDWGFANVNPRSAPDSLIFQHNYIRAVHEMPDPDNGSNNWAVAGWKTQSGHPILSSDMHLGLNLPSLWFLIELSAPGYNTTGFALAGNVGVVAGFNANNAWAFTDVARDERDWYHIDFTDESRSEYKFEGTQIKSTTTIEEIRVRGGETYYDTVIYTHHGPVVYDKNFLSENGQENLALKWIGHTPSRVQEALLGLNRSTSYQDYLEALTVWDAPTQHVAFASTSGDIAIRVQGLWPNKFKDQGLFIMDGSQKAMEWAEFIPTEHYAYQHNPERGFVSSANQHSMDTRYPYWHGWSNPDHYRSRRINSILSQYDSASITPQDMMHLQQDSYGILPEEILPLLLDTLSMHANITEDSVYSQLKQWNYEYNAKAFAPAAFISWWKHFKKLLWDEMDREDIALNQPTDYQTIYLFRQNQLPADLIDHKGTKEVESLSRLVAMSYDSMKSSLIKWNENNELPLTWGNYKHTAIIHLSRVPALSRWNIQVSGEDDAINSTKPNHGPSQRLVVEMSSPPRAWAVIPGGQSGNPGNPAYDNMITMWRDGEYYPLHLLQTPTSGDLIKLTQTLSPSEE